MDNNWPGSYQSEGHQLQGNVFNSPVYFNSALPTDLGKESTHRTGIEDQRRDRSHKLDWMSTVKSWKQHKEIKSKRAPGSCEWLLKTSNFKAWVDSRASSLLWLHGDPGCGKTYLSSKVIDCLKDPAFTAFHRPTFDPKPLIAYFYCSRDRAAFQRSDPTMVMRTITRQIIAAVDWQLAQGPLSRIYENAIDEDDDSVLTIHECSGLILEATKGATIFILIDGFDECIEGHERERLIRALLDLKRVSSLEGLLLKIFVASRPHKELIGYFGTEPNYLVSAKDNSPDIKRFVTTELDRLLGGNINEDLFSNELILNIKKTLDEQAAGNFRWVGLQINSLLDTRKFKVEEDIWDALQSLPQGLKASYDVIYDQIGQQAPPSTKMARRAIAWLLGAERTLSTEALIQALNLEESRRVIKTPSNLENVCCGFVRHHKELDQFQIFHFSAREYFEKDRTDWTTPSLHRIIGYLCVKQCLTSYRYYQEPDTSNKDNLSFRDYADVYWPYHCEIAGDGSDFTAAPPIKLEDTLHSFLLGAKGITSHFQRWVNRITSAIRSVELGYGGSHPKGLRLKLLDSLGNEYDLGLPCSRTLVACAFGFAKIVELMIAEGHDFNVQNLNGLQPAYVAARHEQANVEKLLEGLVTVPSSAYARSQQVLAAVRTGNSRLIRDFLKQKPTPILTYDTLAVAASACNPGTFRMIWDNYNISDLEKRWLMPFLLELALSNPVYGQQTAKEIIQHQPVVTTTAFLNAASNVDHGSSLIKLLLKQRKIEPTEFYPVFQALCKTSSNAYTLFNIFPGINLQWIPYERLLINAAENASPDLLKDLVEGCPRSAFTQQVLEIAAGNSKCGEELIDSLLQTDLKDIDMDGVIVAASRNHRLGHKIVKKLIKVWHPSDSCCAYVLETVTAISGVDKSIVESLLTTHKGEKLPSTIFHNAAHNNPSGSALMRLLFKYRRTQMSAFHHWLPRAIFENPCMDTGVLESTIAEFGTSWISHETVLFTCGLPRADALAILLEKAKIRPSHDFVEAALSNEVCPVELCTQLSRLSPLEYDVDLLALAVQNKPAGDTLVRMLISQDEEDSHLIRTLPDDVVVRTCQNKSVGHEILRILVKHFHCRITTEVVSACAENTPLAYDLYSILREEKDWKSNPLLHEQLCETAFEGGNLRLWRRISSGCFRPQQVSTRTLRSLEISDVEIIEKLYLKLDNEDLDKYFYHDLIRETTNRVDRALEFIKILVQQRKYTIGRSEILGAAQRWTGAIEMLELFKAAGYRFELDQDDVHILAEKARYTTMLWFLSQGHSLCCGAEALVAAAGNPGDPVHILQLLLNQNKDLGIPQRAVKVASSNDKHAFQVLHFLWKKGVDMRITEDEAASIAEKTVDPVLVLNFILSQNEDLVITEKILLAATRNRRSGLAAFHFLWPRHKGFNATENVMASVAEYGVRPTETLQLICHKNDELRITGTLFSAAARNRVQALKLLRSLWHKTRGFELTDNFMVAAAENRSDADEIFRYLWHEDQELEISEAVALAAVRNQTCGEKLVQLLLGFSGTNFPMTEVVVTAAAKNYVYGAEIMGLLLNRHANDVKITNEIILAAARNTFGGMQMMELFLDRRAAEVEITEEVVEITAQNSHGGLSLMKLLLDRRPDEFQVTERVIVAAAQNAFEGTQLMELLLDRRPDEFQVTEKVILAAAQNTRAGTQLMKLLLDRRPDEFQVTERVIVAAAQNTRAGTQLMKLLLNLPQAEISITQEMLSAAAGNYRRGKSITALLLDHGGRDLDINEQVLSAAAGNPRYGHEIIKLLLPEPQEKLESMPKASVADILHSAAVCGQERVIEALSQGSHHEERLVKIAQLYNAAHDGRLAQMEELIANGTPFDLASRENVTPLWLAAHNGHEFIVDILLRTKAVDVNIRPRDGRTPLLEAEWHGHWRIVEVLEEYGAERNSKDE